MARRYPISSSRSVTLLVGLALLTGVQDGPGAENPAAQPEPLTLVVMDPLALPLSCPCVQGYAQRDYTKLAEHLQAELRRPVKVAFHESLTAALRDKTDGKADIIIGKRSVVLFDAKRNHLEVDLVARLTGKDGGTTQTGLIVVPTGDPAKSVADLGGYRIFFGPVESEEKHAAALALLMKYQVPIPAALETSAACDEGACKILELAPATRAAAVISSYAKPLLEGCGTIKKGDLRVIGETAAVPFIEVFATSAVPAESRQQILAALSKIAADPILCLALETQQGFVPAAAPLAADVKKKNGTSP